MFKILFRYLISQPNFLKLHVKNLTEFVLNEIEKSFISYKNKLILRALSIFFIGSGILYWISTNKRTESIFRIIVVKTKTETQLFLDSLRK